MRLQTQLLVQEAKLRNLKVEIFEEEWNMDAIRISNNSKSELIIKGAVYQSIKSSFEKISDNKQASKHLLRESGVPVPISFLIKDLGTDIEAIEKYLENNKDQKKWVCKPIDGTHGNAVLLDIKKAQDVKDHMIKNSSKYKIWLLEEQIPGDDIRIQVVAGKIVAACRREPAYVIGDGEKSIEELCFDRHQYIQQQNPVNELIIDEISKKILKEQGYTSIDIPDNKIKVAIKNVANMSQGAYAVDITESLHTEYFKIAERIANTFDMSIFAIDALSVDAAENPMTHAKIIEINARPHWLQHTFSEVKKHDIAKLIIESLFPLEKN